MKILHTADWHLGRRLEGRARHDEQEAVLDEICRIADDEQIDAVLVAGDVFDTYNPPAEAEGLFYRTMTRLADGGHRAVVVLAGNHDSPDRLIASSPYARALGISTLGYPKDVPVLYDGGNGRSACVESAPSFVRLRTSSGGYLSILALPYPSETRLREIISEELDDDAEAQRSYNDRIRGFLTEAARMFRPDEASIIASHLYVDGSTECDSERQIQIGGAYAVDAGSFPADASYVALGHLHRPQEKRGERDIPVRYSGSILQYSFSEADQQKSVTIVEFDGARSSHRLIPLSAGRRLQQWIVPGGMEELERRLAEVDAGTWLAIRVTLDSTLSLDEMARLRSAHPGIIDCKIDPPGVPADALERIELASLSLEAQFRHYVEQRFGHAAEENVVKLFMALTGDQ